MQSDLLEVEKVFSSCGIYLERNKRLGLFLDTDKIDRKKREKLDAFLKEENAEYYSEKERRNIILQKLFLAERPITIDKLAQEVKTGRSTIVSDLPFIERYLERNRLALIKKPHSGLVIEEDEKNLRIAIVDYLRNNYTEYDLLNLSSIEDNKLISENYASNILLEEYLNVDQFEKINDLFLDFEEYFNVSFSDDGRLNIVLFIAVMIKRMALRKYVSKPENVGISYTNIQALQEWLKRSLTDADICGEIPNDEIDSLIYYILVQSKYLKGKLIAGEYSDIGRLVHEFVARVEKILNVDLLNDNSLLESMLLHFEATVNRILFDVQVNNPLKEEIIQRYPEIYKACKEAGKIFVENFGKGCNEDELTFLALYIAVSLEGKKQSTLNGKMKAVLVCASGIGTSIMLKARVENELPNVDIQAILSVADLDDYELNDIDFVITTTSILPQADKKVFYVSPLLKGNEVNAIRNYMMKNHVYPGNSRGQMITELMNIVTQEATVTDYERLYKRLNSYFFQGKKEERKRVLISDLAEDSHVLIVSEKKEVEDLIELGSILLEQDHSVFPGFADELKKSREILGDSIVIGEGVALLHTKAFDLVNRLSASFIVLKEETDFGINEVQPVRMVITLAALKDSSHLGVLGELLELLTEKKVLQSLFEVHDAEEFRNILTAFENNYLKKGE